MKKIFVTILVAALLLVICLVGFGSCKSDNGNQGSDSSSSICDSGSCEDSSDSSDSSTDSSFDSSDSSDDSSKEKETEIPSYYGNYRSTSFKVDGNEIMGEFDYYSILIDSCDTLTIQYKNKQDIAPTKITEKYLVVGETLIMFETPFLDKNVVVEHRAKFIGNKICWIDSSSGVTIENVLCRIDR